MGMNWEWTPEDPDAHLCRAEVTGSNFSYSDGRLSRSRDMDDAESERPQRQDEGPLAPVEVEDPSSG
ncbi:MAG: hypothetical protein OXE50_02785 [Chloroflexi bacterium]|nr:hypothetical protein [Chloroflexota bacterium]